MGRILRDNILAWIGTGFRIALLCRHKLVQTLFDINCRCARTHIDENQRTDTGNDQDEEEQDNRVHSISSYMYYDCGTTRRQRGWSRLNLYRVRTAPLARRKGWAAKRCCALQI